MSEQMAKKLIAGNWKMNGLTQDGVERVNSLLNLIPSDQNKGNYELLVCPPMTLLDTVQNLVKDSDIKLGGQNCHYAENGAHTGDVSAEMLKDTGCEYVIIGHSERRATYGEDDLLVAAKAVSANDAGLTSIICVGEQAGQRDAGQAEATVGQQITSSIPKKTATAENTVVAYEPVWAIGTGKVASLADIANMHKFIRQKLQDMMEDADKVRILYGGSVKAENAQEIMAIENVDGVLVGGASLDAQGFWGIAQNA